jgi:hypothetical protein
MSILKKQFNEKDIQRVRNLVKVNLVKEQLVVLGIQNQLLKSMEKVIFGKKVEELGLLKMVLKKMLLN